MTRAHAAHRAAAVVCGEHRVDRAAAGPGRARARELRLRDERGALGPPDGRDEHGVELVLLVHLLDTILKLHAKLPPRAALNLANCSASRAAISLLMAITSALM